MWPQSRCSNFKAEVAAGEEKEEEDKEQCECIGGGGIKEEASVLCALGSILHSRGTREGEWCGIGEEEEKKKKKKRCRSPDGLFRLLCDGDKQFNPV